MMLCPRCAKETSARGGPSGLLELLQCDSCHFELLPRDFPSTWHLPPRSQVMVPGADEFPHELERALFQVGSTPWDFNSWGLSLAYLESLQSTLAALLHALPDLKGLRIRLAHVDHLKTSISPRRDSDGRPNVLIGNSAPHPAISEMYWLLLRHEGTGGTALTLLANTDLAFRWEHFVATPADPAAAVNLGYSHLRVSELSRLVGDVQTAYASIEAAIAVRDEQRSWGSPSRETGFLLADAQRARARLGEWDGFAILSARDCLRREVATWKTKMADAPTNPQVASDLCGALREACMLALADGDLDGAKALRTAMCEQLRAWNTANPRLRLSDPLADTEAASKLDTI